MSSGAEVAQASTAQHSNIVPFQLQDKTFAPGGIQGRYVDQDNGSDPRPIILFDLNGTLTSLTATKYTTGRSLVRPGIDHLRRLQDQFRLGIFSSATPPTVQSVLPVIEAAAGSGPALFPDQSLIFHRGHTVKASASHMASGGKEWDTVKPLHKWFRHVDRVLLMDDDAYKAADGEQSNMILVPCWKEEEPEDMHLKIVVDTLLKTYHGIEASTDVRLKTSIVTEALSVLVAANVAQRVNGIDAVGVGCQAST